MRLDFDSRALVSSPEALFRYQIVSQVLALQAGGHRLSRAARLVAARDQATLRGEMRRVSLRSVYRWVETYRQLGLDGLEPQMRAPVVDSLVLPEAFCRYAVFEKRRDPRASVPELIKRAREAGVLSWNLPVSRSTVFRFLLRQQVSTRRVRRQPEADMRRFAYPHRLQMVLADGKHFRAGPRRTKRVALFYLDDATRYGLHVVVGPTEDTGLFLRGLHGLVCRQGFPDTLFLDRGPGFISEATFSVCASLSIPLIHGKARYPQGHGKIERFNQTAKAAVLRQLSGRADVDADCGHLELRLLDYLHRVYNRSPHESLDGATPLERFLADEKPLRLPENLRSVEEKFCLHEDRRVSPDHIVEVDGVAYETPRGLAGHMVTLRRGLLEGTVDLLDRGRLVRLAPVDLAFNARDPRGSGTGAIEPEPVPVPGSAELGFKNRFAPIVDADGGFQEPTASEGHSNS